MIDKCKVLTEPRPCKFCGRSFPTGQMVYLSTEKAYACRECYNKEYFEKQYEEQKKQWKRIPTFREETLRDILLKHLWEMKEAYSHDIELLCKHSMGDETKYFEDRLAKVEEAIKRATTIEEWPVAKMNTMEDWLKFTGQPFK